MTKPDHLKELEAFAERGRGAEWPAWMLLVSGAVTAAGFMAVFWR